MDWSHYRKLFPHLPDKIYLNHAAIAPMNSRAHAALEDFYSQRMKENIEFWPAAVEKKQEFIGMIGRLIHASPQNIALAPNTSAGLNILALGLSWKPGDRILLNDFEFPSNVIPFVNLRRLGVEIDFVQNREGKIQIEDILANIKPRTRLLSISFVEFLNGFRNNLQEISRICHEREIVFCVDAIQGLGGLQVDVEEMGIDYLATGGHKWLMWPAGLGFVYIAPRIFDEVYPAQAGWLSLQTPWDFFNYYQDFAETAERFEPGTFNTSAVVAASATLGMMLEIGTRTIEDKVLANTEYLVSGLQEAGYRLFTDTRAEHRSGIVSFYHDRAEALHEFLKKQDITVSLREGKIRLSPHFYNNEEDFDRCLKAIMQFDNKL